MKKTIIASVTVLFALTACSEPAEKTGETGAVEAEQISGSDAPVETNVVDPNEIFSQLSNELIEEYWVVNPTSALYRGYTKYDDQLVVPTDARRASEVTFYEGALARLVAVDPEGLSASHITDHVILTKRFQRSLWYLKEFRQFEWNPSSYNVAGGFGRILNTPYKSMDERLRVISRRLENVPAYYEAAKASIKVPTLEHTDLAILQNKGGLAVFETAIPAALETSGLDGNERLLLAKELEEAAAAVKGYILWLEDKRTQLVAGEVRSFRIGAKLYEEKFAHDIVSGRSAEELYQLALEEKTMLHERMTGISRKLWPTYFAPEPFPENELLAVRRMIDHLSHHHVERENFIEEIRGQLPGITAFIVEKDLLDVDPSRPLVVRETPAYQRGVAGASVSAPGPYDATGNTYYNVTPLDSFTEEEAESYLREYNDWVLQILTIHEALPGHYTQRVHANKTPSLVKALFGNGAMTEGWAVYSELMMLENGFGNNEPEMWLMYSKWNLRSVMNTIIDYSIHVLDMPEEEVMNLLLNEAFQQQTEADKKWIRATVSQVQLTSYFSGYADILALRAEMKELKGEDFDIKTFNNTFLSYGSVPVPVIRELMLESLEE